MRRHVDVWDSKFHLIIRSEVKSDVKRHETPRDPLGRTRGSRGVLASPPDGFIMYTVEIVHVVNPLRGIPQGRPHGDCAEY